MPRARIIALCCALLLASGAYLMAQQQPLNLTVEIANGNSGALIEFAINAGKVAETTIASDGNALSILDMSNLGKVRVDIYVEVCEDGRTVVRVLHEGQMVPEDDGCDRRPLGAFWLADGMRVSIDMLTMTAEISGGGLSTPVKVGIGAAVAGGIAGAVVGLTGDSAAMIDAGNPETPGQPDEPDEPSNPFQALINRTFTGTGVLQTNTCSFFASTSAITITINTADADGSGTLTKVHTNAGVTFNHQITITGSGTTFNVATDTITQGIGGQTFLSQITEFQINGNTLTANQRSTRGLGSSNECHDHYAPKRGWRPGRTASPRRTVGHPANRGSRLRVEEIRGSAGSVTVTRAVVPMLIPPVGSYSE